MEKFKRMFKKFRNSDARTKLKVVSGIIVSLVVVIVAALGIGWQVINKKGISPELARAMTYDEVKDGDEDVEGTDGHVNFDAFFLRDLNGDGYAESIRGTCKEVGEEDTLYMEISVNTAGYLKSGKITINADNFYFQTALLKDGELKENYIGNNIRKIEFNQLNNGIQRMIIGVVRSGDYSYSSSKDSAIGNNVNNYSKLNSITFTGTYVPEEGEPVEVTKTVNFNIDWYGETKATISNTSTTYRDLDDRIDEENGTISLDFSIGTSETKNELMLKDNHVEAQIPQLNGYDPISVEYTGSNATSNYNAQTRTLTIDREAKVEEDGTVTTGLSNSNSYNIKVIYPLEAYQSVGGDTVQIKIPVSTYYEGYNNSNEEFENPYKSNIASTTLTATYKHVEVVEEPVEPVEPSKPPVYPANSSVTIGKYTSSPTSRYVVSKLKPLKIYNGVSEDEQDDTYQIEWYAYTGTNGATNGLVLKETQNGKAQKVDNFIKTDSNKESMEDVTTNIGIAFSGASDVLKDDGWIKVYDEDTGNLLETFTKDNWSRYTSSNPYKYDLPVKHIRVETSETNADARLYVYNIKKLDDEYITTNYTKEEFDNLQYIETNLAVYLGGNLIGTKTHKANYEVPYSVADIGISKNTISTQITEKNEKITITARYNSLANQAGWVDGSFIVKLPEGILTAKINSVQINNNDVSITSYEVVEQDGVNLIKINTENKNDTPQTYSITVDVDITPNPMAATTKGNIELYASNGEICDYYYKASDIYDVNNNLNTEEQVNHDTTSFSMISPTSLLTNQIGSNYDDKGSTIVSPQVADVRPAYGVVDKEHEKEATIGVQVTNNYGNRISEIQILGKIPFKGNTYVLSGGDLGSTFTTRMTEAGITVPEKLQQYVTVYYSENENPDRDLSKSENGWKTADEITNWDNIKTYLIDFGDYVMPTGENYSFNYTVKIPNGVEFNQEAYSHHGVYFSLETEQGKYRTQVEPNKLGFRIAEKYNLELIKYQTGKEKVIPGATYSITDEVSGEIKTAVTNTDGTLTIKNLYAEKAYLIKEIKTPSDYELNSDVIRFIGHVDENGNLTIEKTQGNTREDMQVIKNEGEDYKATVKVEDEVKANIKIHKTEQGTGTPIQTVKYKLTGYGLPENGRFVITNRNGEVTINGLSVNQEYTLEELKAEGYYLADPITFKIINENGNYSIQTTAGTIAGQSTEEKDSIPTVTINLEDEKTPRYSLQIIKVKKTLDTTLTENEEEVKDEIPQETPELTYLAGAKFKLYKGTKEIGEYITDETGTVTIDDLYQYIEGKVEDATYTLKEVLAPEGYVKVKDITFKVDGTDGSLKLINEDGTEEKYTVEENTVKLTIEDSPSFKLIKKDAETGNTLANIKFAIYNVENGDVPATNSKGKIIGTKETINGKEYYTVQTNEAGELTADLPEGLYKAVEVQAPEKYDLEGQVYYFGIGASRETEEGLVATWAESFGGDRNEKITSVAETNDGGYIVGGYFASSIQVGNETITNNGNTDGLIIKYSSEGEVEWAKSFGGDDNDYIQSVAETEDGGYIAGGYFYSSSIQVGNETITNNSSASYSAYSDGLIIKYNSSGEVEWAKSIGGDDYDYDYIQSVAATSDGGIIAGGYFESSKIQVGNETITNNGNTDGLIIKYSSEGEVEWAKSIGGDDDDYIESVAATSDGGIIAGGYFESSKIQVGNETITKTRSRYYDGLIIKYSSEGEEEWAKSFGGDDNDYIESVAETEDGGYIAGGYFYSSSIQVGNETITNNGGADGLIIKYSSEGEEEWAKSFGGDDDDYIQSVAATSDGGYIVGGYFSSRAIQVGNETLVNNSDRDFVVSQRDYNYYIDGLIIKYSSEGEVEYAKVFGGNSNDYIYSVAETKDDRYIAVGCFASESIQVGNKTLTNNNYDSFYKYTDALIIKFQKQEKANHLVFTNATSVGGSADEQITSVASTSDGGYIVGGYFGDSITVGNETLTNHGVEDGLIIKYNREGSVEWAESFGGDYYDNITSVAETKDGGYIAGGYFGDSITVGNETLTGKGQEGLIIKYNKEGAVEWAKSFGGNSTDYIQSVASTSDGGFIVGGTFYSSTIQVGEETLTNKGSEDGLIIKYNKEGAVEWAKSFGGEDYDYIQSVAETKDGGYIVGGYFSSSTIQVGEETLTNKGYRDGLIIKYNKEGQIEWADSFGDGYNEKITSVAATSDGGFIVGGYFDSSTIQVGEETLTGKGQDGLIIKYNKEGVVEWAKSIGGSSGDYIQSVAATKDGGIIAGGYFDSGTFHLGEESLVNNSKGDGYGSFCDDGIIIKYNSEGQIEWAKSIGGSTDDQITSVAEKEDGKIVAGGYFVSKTIEIDGHTLTNKSDSSAYDRITDGMILEVVNQVVVPEVQELTVENSRKEFKITTDVKEIDGEKGGSISGEDLKPYETVKYGDSNTKDIVMTPDENYEILGITVNGEEWPFTANTDGTYTIPKQTFKNMTEDKHIEVTYALKTNKITINKEDSKTGTKLPGATFEIKSEDGKTTIKVSTNSKGQAITQLKYGKYTITEIEAPEGYELNSTPLEIEFNENGEHEFTIKDNKLAQVIVHHYLKDKNGEYTTTKVAEDELQEGKTGENYTTSPKLDLEKYELEKDEKGEYVIPTNATGEFTEKTIEVKYYYESKKIALTVHHYIEGTTTSVPLKNGETAQDIKESGEEGEKYTTSPIEDSLLSDDYELVERPTNATGTYTSPEVVVTYYYRRVSRQVVINKLAEDGKTPLQGATFKIQSKEVANKIEQSAEVGALTSSGDYYFELSNGKLISNNQGEDSTTANSYIKIDLTGKPDATLKINAEISSQSYDYGYAIVNQVTSNPSYSTTTGRIFRISGQVDAKDYETTLTGGKVYYLHLGYYKNYSTSSYDDTFTINSIKLNDINIIGLVKMEATTNSKGQITTNLESGDYVATEISVPEGYQLPANPKTEFSVTKADDVVTLNITNTKVKGTVITHYYIEGTTDKVPLQNGGVAEDVIYTGNVGDIYATKGAEDILVEYELVRTEGETSGTIENGTKEVIYYYRLKNSNLTIVKTNEQGEGLEGAEFKIENKENGKVNYATTGAEGKVTVQVPVGESIITETKAPRGYKLNKEPVNIKIELDKENVVTIQNKAINYYTLELSKIDAETKELISGVEFNLTYADHYGENHDNTYTTDLNGKITLENLEDEIVYTLKETKTPKGYVKDTEEKQFVVHYVDGAYQIEILKGILSNIETENNTIKVNIENKPSLKIVKQDNHGQPIQGVKFTITDEQGQEVTDGFGNTVGTIENIDGKMLRVLTTDANGVITENLVPGKYVITEVQAPWQYALPEDENERKQTIEITSEGFEASYVEQAGITQIDTNNLQELMQNMEPSDALSLVNTEITAEGKIALTLSLSKDVTIPGKYTVSGQDINLKLVGLGNAVNMILTQDGKVEKAVLIKADENSLIITSNILSMLNGDYITLGVYMGTIRIPAEDTVNNQELTLSTTGFNISPFIARYNSEGKIESLKDITYLGIDLLYDYTSIYLKDLNGKIEFFYPYEGQTLTIPGSETSQGEEITVNNETESLVVILDDELKVTNAIANPMGAYVGKPPQIEILSTGGMLQGIRNDEEGGLVIPGEQTVSGEQITLNNYGDGILVTLTAEGKIEWAKPLGSQAGMYLNVTEVSDGYLTIAYYMGNLVIPAEETKNGEEIRVENSADTIKFSLIKYTTDGKVEWVTDAGIDMNDSEYIMNMQIRESKNGYAIIMNNGKVISFERKYSEPIVKEQAVVTIQNTISKGSLVVHHYKEGTTESLSDDETSIGELGKPYETLPANDIPANYELVETPTNANGTYVEGETVVTYYYRLKTPKITNQTIQKTGTETIESTNQQITYNIHYTAELKDYSGDATVVIVDTLPYLLDTTKTNIEEDLAGGTYNPQTNTIRWEEQLENINTFEEGTKKIDISKEIRVVYSNIDTLQESFINNVSGKLELNNTETEEVTDEHETDINVQGNVIAKYLEEGTNNVIAEEVTKGGKVGTSYETEQKDITGYDFIRVEGETSGNFIEGTIEVTYYYRLKDPIIEDEISKVTDTIVLTDKNQKIPYTIDYNTTITDYKGNAIVTIVDYLPYEIDENLSKLNGGSYNRIDKTITWTEEITGIDTYTQGTKEINETKDIELVYENVDVTKTTIDNNATGTIKLDTPQKEHTVEEGEELPVDFRVDVPVEKIWDDNNDIKENRPESVTIQLTADGSAEYNGEQLEQVVLNEANGWKYTFENLPKYTDYGREITYSVEELETNPGDLEYYKAPEIENLEGTIRVTNRYNLMDTQLISEITKKGTEKITSSKDKVSYDINYEATLTDYIGEALVTITDYLPYHIDEEKSDLDGGIYDEASKTITWTVAIDHINTELNGPYKVDEARNITVVFSDLDASQRVMLNRVTGTIDLYETEETNTVEDTFETEVEVPARVIVKYVDKNTGEEIAEREEENGLVGDEYTTEQKEIYGYTYIENSGNTEGEMTEEDTEVIYYYERTEAGKVTAIYIDEETGEEISDREVIGGYVGDKYNTEQKEIENYEFVRVEGEPEGEPEGELTEEEKTVIYVYKKIPAKVIVRYLEKDSTPDDDTDNKVLAEEETINGFSGDEYTTARKEVQYYRAAEPEPTNATGTMTREDIIVTYYYEKIPSGTVTAIYVDESTGKEITYVDEETKEETTYKEEYKGYCGEEYKTYEKEIPYYEYVKEKAPENATGMYTEEDVTVTYYYRQLPFNMAVDKNLTKINLNGETQRVINGKINKVEIPVSRVSDSTLKLEYTITVKNTGKVEGTTDVVESLPRYFKVTDGTSKEWKKQKDGTLKLNVTLKAGEEKDYKVVLKWDRGSNNFGALTNTVELVDITNPANFKETTTDDNKSKADLVLSVKSGLDRSMRIVGLTLGILLITAGMIIYVRKGMSRKED